MDPITQYQQNAVATQSPGRIIVMLYEGAIKFLKSAKSALQQQDMSEFVRCMSRTGDIIDELDVSLDVDRGGEVAANLRSLYGFLRQHLLQAQIKKDPRMIDEAVRILHDLHEGWKAIA